MTVENIKHNQRLKSFLLANLFASFLVEKKLLEAISFFEKDRKTIH